MTGAHTLPMAKKAGHPKPKRRPTFIKAWRKARGYTLAQLSERLESLTDLPLSEGHLSRIERGEHPYTQDTLEAIAVVLGVQPAHLLNVDPKGSDPMFSIWEGLSPMVRRRALRIAQEFEQEDKTGTDD